MTLAQIIFIMGLLASAGLRLWVHYLSSMNEREHRLKAARRRWGLSEPGMFEQDEADEPTVVEPDEDGAFWE